MTDRIKPKRIFIPASDNKNRLSVLLYKQPGQNTAEKWIIFVRGGSGTRYQSSDETVYLKSWSHAFCVRLFDKGYSVAIYDSRGQWESGGTRSSMTAKEDFVTVLTWITTEFNLGRRSVGVFGHCQGGALALKAVHEAVHPALAFVATYGMCPEYPKPGTREYDEMCKGISEQVRIDRTVPLIDPQDIMQEIETIPVLVAGSRDDSKYFFSTNDDGKHIWQDIFDKHSTPDEELLRTHAWDLRIFERLGHNPHLDSSEFEPFVKYFIDWAANKFHNSICFENEDYRLINRRIPFDKTTCIEAHIYLPHGATANRWMIIAPGKDGTKPRMDDGIERPDLWYDLLSQRYVAAGYAVLVFNYRKTKDDFLYSEAILDYDEVIRWLRRQVCIQKGSLGIFGFCVGGAIALKHAASNSNGEIIAFIQVFGTPAKYPVERGSSQPKFNATECIGLIERIPIQVVGCEHDEYFSSKQRNIWKGISIENYVLRERKWRVIVRTILSCCSIIDRIHFLKNIYINVSQKAYRNNPKDIELIIFNNIGHPPDPHNGNFKLLCDYLVSWTLVKFNLCRLDDKKEMNNRFELAKHLNAHINEYARELLNDLRSTYSFGGVIISILALATVQLYATQIIHRYAFLRSVWSDLILFSWITSGVLVMFSVVLVANSLRKVHKERPYEASLIQIPESMSIFRAKSYFNKLHSFKEYGNPRILASWAMNQFCLSTQRQQQRLEELVNNTTVIAARLIENHKASKRASWIVGVAGSGLLVIIAMFFFLIAMLPDADDWRAKKGTSFCGFRFESVYDTVALKKQTEKQKIITVPPLTITTQDSCVLFVLDSSEVSVK